MLAHWLQRALPGLLAGAALIVAGCGGEGDPVAVHNVNAGQIGFEDGGTGGWSATGLWHVSTVRPAAGTYALYYGDDTTLTYDTGAANAGDFRRTIDLSTIGRLEFDYFLEHECPDSTGPSPCAFDKLTVEVSTDGGGTWDVLADLADTAGAFQHMSVDLTAYTAPAEVRFRFDTMDLSLNTYEGAHVDNVVYGY